MQLHLTFTTQELLLPMAHRHMIQAMLYHALRQDDPAQATRVHDCGREADGRRFKLFTLRSRCFFSLTGGFPHSTP